MGEPRQEDGAGLLQADDALAVEPAHVAWARMIDRWVRPHTTTSELAAQVCRLLAYELGADHVALWHVDFGDYCVLGAHGLNARARHLRVPTDDPCVETARERGGVARWDTGTDRQPRVSALPGALSPDYAMVLLDDDSPVAMVTLSGEQLPHGAEEQVQALVRGLAWPDMAI